jgi:hypothetical protein
MKTLTNRELKAIFDMSPRIRDLVWRWWDGAVSNAEMQSFRNRFFFRRLVERALRELGYTPEKACFTLNSSYLDPVRKDWLELRYEWPNLNEGLKPYIVMGDHEDETHTLPVQLPLEL